jgi:uncharacterized protein YutE (UPF0331/DUF86 family)
MLKERVFEKLKEIEESLDLIGSNLPESLDEFKKLGLAKDGIYKRLEHCIENLIDIFSMIYSDLDLGIPSDDDDILKRLNENKTFGDEIITLVKDMKGLRNLLIHKYGKIDDDIVFELLTEHLSDFDKVNKEIVNYFKEKSKK